MINYLGAPVFPKEAGSYCPAVPVHLTSKRANELYSLKAWREARKRCLNSKARQLYLEAL